MAATKRNRQRTANGLRRDEHFDGTGTIAGWRGRARRIRDEKHETNRRACRGPIKDN